MWVLRWALYLTLLGAGAFGGLMLVLKLQSGTSDVTVPPVGGLTEEQARFQAERLGMVFEVSAQRYDLKVPRGRVVNQAPASGMAARKGQTLRVVVSKGVDIVTVPDWKGATAAQAQIGAQQAGLRVASLAYLRSPAPPQSVVAQSPAAGASVARESEAALLLSAGPPGFTFVMPDLAGQTEERARYGLLQYGVQTAPARITGGLDPPGTVVAQSPLPGYPLDRNQIVQLTVVAP